jgi:hypothetical protein
LEINPSIRVTILINPDDHFRDIVETVLRKAGRDVMLFTDPEAAGRHLTDS